MRQYLEPVAKSGRRSLLGKVALLFLALPLGVARAQVPCNPTEVTTTLDSTGSLITLDHTTVQCNSVPALLLVNAIDNAPFLDFLEVTYVSGPANILVGGFPISVGQSFPMVAGGFSVLSDPFQFNVAGVYNFQATGAGSTTAAPQTFTVTVTSCPGPPVTAVTAVTNENCDPSINPSCTPNIVEGDGIHFTVATVKVQPAEMVLVEMSTDFGSIENVSTDPMGIAFSTFISGPMKFGSTLTTRAHLSATACGASFPNVAGAGIMNYRGFDFDQSQVSDASFVDSTALDAAAIQQFFVNHDSFLANFILVGDIGGFEDLNGNGALDPGEPTYSVRGAPVPLHAQGVPAASVFAQEAVNFGVNPKVLLATAEKEQSLISRGVLPPAATLNKAMGCGLNLHEPPLGFVPQVRCAASTFVGRFNDQIFRVDAVVRPISYPFFFHASDGIFHNDGTGRESVGFQVLNAAAYAQYRYTNFIQSEPNGGGVHLFETVWRLFGF